LTTSTVFNIVNQLKRQIGISGEAALIKCLLAVAVGIGMASAAQAHTNCDGTSASKISGCCGEGDSLNLSADRVERRGDVWFVNVDGAFRPMVTVEGKIIQILPQDDKAHGECFTVWYRKLNHNPSEAPFSPDDPHASSDGAGAFEATDEFHFYCLQGPLSF
jgi:hypothetical protein